MTFWPTGEPRPTAASVRFGHDESSAAVWTKDTFSEYGPARLAYIEELKTLIAGTPATAAAFARLKQLVTEAKVGGELISLGDSGVILAVEGKLQDAQGRWVDQATYLQRLEERRRELATAVDVMGPQEDPRGQRRRGPRQADRQQGLVR